METSSIGVQTARSTEKTFDQTKEVSFSTEKTSLYGLQQPAKATVFGLKTLIVIAAFAKMIKFYQLA